MAQQHGPTARRREPVEKPLLQLEGGNHLLGLAEQGPRRITSRDAVQHRVTAPWRSTMNPRAITRVHHGGHIDPRPDNQLKNISFIVTSAISRSGQGTHLVPMSE